MGRLATRVEEIRHHHERTVAWAVVQPGPGTGARLAPAGTPASGRIGGPAPAPRTSVLFSVGPLRPPACRGMGEAIACRTRTHHFEP
jgi:hypothetical protein